MDELEFAVAFRTLLIVPSECRALVEWLKVRRIEPMTNSKIHWQYSSLEIIGPLDPWCRDPSSAVKILREELKGEIEIVV